MNKEGLEKSLKKFIKDNNIDFNGTGTNEDDFLESVSLDLALYAYNCDKNDFEVSNKDKDDVLMSNRDRIDYLHNNLINELKTYHLSDDLVDKFKGEFDLKTADEMLNDYKQHPQKYKSVEKNGYKEYHFNENKNKYDKNNIFNEADAKMNELYGDLMNKTLDEKVEDLEAKQGKRALNHIKGDSYYKDEVRLGLYKAYSKIKIAGYKLFWKTEKKVGTFAKGTAQKYSKRAKDLREAKNDKVGHTGDNLNDVLKNSKDLQKMVDNEYDLVQKDNETILAQIENDNTYNQDQKEEFKGKVRNIKGDNGSDKQKETYDEIKSEVRRLKNRIDDLENSEHLTDKRDKIIEFKKSLNCYQGLVDEYELKQLSDKVSALQNKTTDAISNVGKLDEDKLSLTDKKNLMKFLDYGYLANDTLKAVINVYSENEIETIKKGYKTLDKKDRKKVIKDINKVLDKDIDDGKTI